MEIVEEKGQVYPAQADGKMMHVEVLAVEQGRVLLMLMIAHLNGHTWHDTLQMPMSSHLMSGRHTFEGG